MLKRRQILELLSRFGYGQTALDLYTNVSPYGIPKIDDALAETGRQRQERSRGHVLFPIIQGRSGLNIYRSAILARVFQRRGYDPLLVLCHNDLDLCFKKTRVGEDRATCELCQHYGHTMLERFDLDWVSVGSTVDQPPAIDGTVAEYRGVNIRKYATASARKFLRKYRIDHEDDNERVVYEHFLRTGATLVDSARTLLDRFDVDAVLGHDPVYVYGGIFLAVASNHDVPARSLAMGYNDQKLIVGDQTNRVALPQYTDPSMVESALSDPLSPTEEAVIDDLMDDRTEGIGVDVDYAAGSTASLEETDADVTAGLFTNLMWDGSLEATSRTAFPDPFEWVATTVEHFHDRESTALVIKTHPAEALRETNERMDEWLADRFSPLPSNVTVLGPETDVDPYRLIRDVDFGIIWNSTIGLEMAYYGVPTVVAGDTHYRDYGFTFDALSEQEYLDYVRRDTLEMTPDMRDRARRYAHLLFIKKQFPFPFYSRSRDGVDLLPVTAEDIAELEETFDLLVDRIVDGEPVLARSDR